MTSQPPVGLRRLRELRVRRRIERQIAPLGVRLLAVLVSATMAIGFLAALLAAGAGGLRIWRRLRPPQGAPADDHEHGGLFAVEERPGPSALEASEAPSNRLSDKLQSPKGRFVLALVGLLGAVATEGRQGFAARAVGLRRVDVRTGQVMTRSQALVRVATRAAWRTLVQRLAPGAKVA